jgi:hypothetical protein
MAFLDLHEGILGEFAERALVDIAECRLKILDHTRKTAAPKPPLRDKPAPKLTVEERAVRNSVLCAYRQRQLRKDPVLGDAYRAKLAAARRAYRARLKGVA